MDAAVRGDAHAAVDDPCAIAGVAQPSVCCRRCSRRGTAGKIRGLSGRHAPNWFLGERVRIGSFSHLDEILPHHTLKRSVTPLSLPKAANPPEISYRFEEKDNSLDDFLKHQRVTGFLLIKDGQMLAERYQYDRTAQNRFVSHSMAKSIVSLAVGMALAEKKIASLDDTIAKYVPELAGNAYGETTIRNMLRMSSGVPSAKSTTARTTSCASFASAGTDSITALRDFNTREAEQGTRFHYASNETVVLTLLLRAVTGTTLSEYLTTRLWQPMGAEADATWVKTPTAPKRAWELSTRPCATMAASAFCSPMTAPSAASRSCPRTICSRPPTGTVSPRRSRHEGDALLRLRLSVLALPRREAPLCAARRLRAVDLRRSRAQAGDGDHRRDQDRRVVGGVLSPRARCAVAQHHRKYSSGTR